jgi:hypothetical protein
VFRFGLLHLRPWSLSGAFSLRKAISVASLAIFSPFLSTGAEPGVCVNKSGSPREKLEDIVSCTAADYRLSSFGFSSNAKGIKVSDGGEADFGPGIQFSDRMKVSDSSSATWRFQYQVTAGNPGFLVDAARLAVQTGDWKNGTGAVYKYLCIGGAFETELDSGSCSGTLHTLNLNPAGGASSTIATFTGVTSFWVLDVVSLHSRGGALQMDWVRNQFRQIRALQGR